MIIPPIPKPKFRKPKFPDPDERLDKLAFRRMLNKILIDLRNSLPDRKGLLINKIDSFVGRLVPQELSNLPYISKDGKAKHANKNECVLALISQTIQEGWAYQEGKENETHKGIEKIKEITKKGLDNFKVIGNEKGYELEINP